MEEVMALPNVRDRYLEALATDVDNGIVGEGAGEMKALMFDLMRGELGKRLSAKLYERPGRGKALRMKRV